MHTLLPKLRALEIELHHPCSRERLEYLLHLDFHEVGRSGRRYDRHTVLSVLSEQADRPAIQSDDFKLAELASGVVLLTYRTAQRQPDGALTNHTLRASVWVNADARWQLRYHQGTQAVTPDHPREAGA
ncbi:MAG: DUF4440 domain-containing protein [Pseudomonadota bacterium]